MSIRYEDMEQAIGLNWYLVDPNLALQMDRHVDPVDRAWADGKLRAMGALIGGTVAENAEVTDKNPAQLVRWDREGNEVNRVVHHASALETKRLLWKNDFLHLRWTDDPARRGRPVPSCVPLAYSYLLAQADTGMLCSVGMTAGVLRLIERYGDEETRELFAPRLRLNDYDRGWDGSMYLTEKAGGSDLGASETTARLEGGAWKLNGSKWFCSNVDGRAIVTLARPEGAPAGIKGLALFAVPRVYPDGRTNGVHIRRIKDKLGTRAVPTGEIDLVDATGYLLAGGQDARDGRGINRMMEFVNESRLGVAAMGAGIMRRAFLEAAIRAQHRHAFGRAIADHGMVREQLIDLMVASEAAAALLFQVTARLPSGGQAIGEGDPLVRILVPITKMRCTRGGVESASAALEVFGGNGYIENFPLARQLRDAQCHTLWEGTENILSLDVLRASAKDGAHTALLDFLNQAVERAGSRLLARLRASVSRASARLAENLARVAAAGPDVAMLRARLLANEAADAVQSALLLEEAEWELGRGSARKAAVAAWFIRTRLEPQGRWHAGHEGTALELFDPLTRYESMSAERVAQVCQL